ncbi:DUF262 domain-containing protein [Mitsuokella multacida]|uniref:DUF262 domain-containing protein n=1 Tax=Mitsuokella multacida TaxID=52226 RepID=UPI0022E0482F|nr:DUF262 domain-containing protein [Mitsuokella multacida]
MGENIDLISEIEDKIKTVRTRSLDLSFNELLDMYKSGELIIDPDYQRLFRWSVGQQSRFIETLLLEMPVPPIFVIEKEEGIYELIDGLQRISTYLHFRGEHPDYENPDYNDVKAKFLRLAECDICTHLNGLTYKDIPKTLEIRLKRSFIRVEVLRKESDSRLRYHMFKRLNTGGSKLSDQEIRNCTIRLLSPDFNNFLIKCSQNNSFKSCISNISQEKIDQKYDQELVLRFFAMKNMRDKYLHDVSGFLTECMEYFSIKSNKFDYIKEENIFQKTFKILFITLRERAFSPSTKTKKYLSSKFAIYHYEAFSLSIAKYVDKLDNLNQNHIKKLHDLLESIKFDDEFINMTTGGGKNYAGPLDARLQFVDERIRDFCDEL